MRILSLLVVSVAMLSVLLTGCTRNVTTAPSPQDVKTISPASTVSENANNNDVDSLDADLNALDATMSGASPDDFEVSTMADLDI